MPARESQVREVALPASALVVLRRVLRTEVGPLATIHSLHATGFESGDDTFAAFERTLKGPLDETSETTFWAALSRFLRERGWGNLQHTAPHAGVGLLTSSDWAEAAGEPEGQPACSFSVGLFSRLLTRAAGEPVAVLETSCRARGDDCCTFAFGSEATIHDLYGLLLEGHGLETALAEL